VPTVTLSREERAAAAAARTEAVATAKGWSDDQKQAALSELLAEKKLGDTALERLLRSWGEQLEEGGKQKLDWLRDAFGTRYQRKQEDGTFAPRLREATTVQVVERLVTFALSASDRERYAEKDLGLFEYTGDPVTGEALLTLSDKLYGAAVTEDGYNQVQALLRKLAQQHGDLKVDGKSLTELVGQVQGGLKVVGQKLDLGLPKKLGGLRTTRQEEEYKKRFAAYQKGLVKKAEKAKAAEAVTNPDGKTTPVVGSVVGNSASTSGK
jgi:hypothetical protein